MTSSPSQLSESFGCQDYTELENIDQAFRLWQAGEPNEWCFQLKYDGIWAKIVIVDGLARVYSKTGQLKLTLPVEPWMHKSQETVLVGEFMYGSQWSKHPDRTGLIYVFDCLVDEGEDISVLPFVARKAIADNRATELGSVFRRTHLYSVTTLGNIWLHIEASNEYEGLIIRKRAATWFSNLWKLKTEVEDDFIILNINPGEGKHAGKLGSFDLGVWNAAENCVVPVITENGRPARVGGGFSDAEREEFFTYKMLGKVCLVRGKGRFSTGAIRHPDFVKIRDDKKPEDCRLK